MEAHYKSLSKVPLPAGTRWRDKWHLDTTWANVSEHGAWLFAPSFGEWIKMADSGGCVAGMHETMGSLVRRRRWTRNAIHGGFQVDKAPGLAEPQLLARIERSRKALREGGKPNRLMVGVLCARGLRSGGASLYRSLSPTKSRREAASASKQDADAGHYVRLHCEGQVESTEPKARGDDGETEWNAFFEMKTASHVTELSLEAMCGERMLGTLLVPLTTAWLSDSAQFIGARAAPNSPAPRSSLLLVPAHPPPLARAQRGTR